ncbi:MAG TPA: helix-turn-helix domain-containing protein [Bryobacteraceae bacterium]|jgi:DNA-binding HxlR family transcriptional regulator|nr:helix-turn-helix domain-containing protein [Bryobacteraceae bacterium]
MAKAKPTVAALPPEESEGPACCCSLSDDEETVIREVISRVMDKWALWALSELVHRGRLRFSRLMERVEGVSQKSLTATLRNLERDGLITRTVTAQVPIRVDYEATPLGRGLMEQVHPLWMWSAEHLQSFIEARRRFDTRLEAEKAIRRA